MFTKLSANRIGLWEMTKARIDGVKKRWDVYDRKATHWLCVRQLLMQHWLLSTGKSPMLFPSVVGIIINHALFSLGYFSCFSPFSKTISFGEQWIAARCSGAHIRPTKAD